MQTNQIFNFTRFGRYAKSTLTLHYRQLLLMTGVVAASLFLYIVIITNTAMMGNWYFMHWIVLFYTTGGIGGIFYAGSAFPSFRKKETTISFLIVPASILEKFIYEFFEKIMLFWILFPTIFYVFGNLAIQISKAIREIGGLHTDMKPFSSLLLTQEITESQMKIIIFLGMALFTVAFAGAATFRKYPLIKTVLFAGALLAITVGYIFLLQKELHLLHPWIEPLGDTWSEEHVIAFACSILTLVSLVALAYSYFKVKEKEVQ